MYGYVVAPLLTIVYREVQGKTIPGRTRGREMARSDLIRYAQYRLY